MESADANVAMKMVAKETLIPELLFFVSIVGGWAFEPSYFIYT